MIEIQKAITSLLKTIHERVYFENAEKNATFPYIVYNLPYSNNEKPEIITLEINGWDKSESTIALDTLMSQINDELDKKTIYIGGKVACTIFRETRNNVEDPDQRFKRRRYTYQIRSF